jgi:hypothetical protein
MAARGIRKGDYMKYIQIQRKKTEGFITIGEYIKAKQPEIIMLLLKFKRTRAVRRDVTDLILTAADITGADKHYRSIMQERPKGGRGGLLPGEKEEVL